MRVVFYISGHGFGHASRAIELIRTVLSRRPDARVAVRTAVPQWLFGTLVDAYGPRMDVQPLEADTGIVQLDSLRIDEEETVRQAVRFYATFDRRVAAEAELLRREGADVVVGDIPPLAFAAAACAGVPSIAVANFTWDWIYGIYPELSRIAPDLLPAIRSAYASATSALRLPMHGGFEPMASVTRDIPFITWPSSRNRVETRHALGINSDRPVVLPSFGVHGADLPVERLARGDRFTLIDPRREPPSGLLYRDLVAAADVVVSKPGHGIVSECLANGTALLYTSRGRFVEYDVFVAEMPRVVRCRYLSQEDLLAGDWDDAIDALLQQAAPPERPRIDGAAVAADEIIDLIE
jgi:L-arabinokinase